MKKRINIVMAAICVTVFGLTACAGGGETTDESAQSQTISVGGQEKQQDSETQTTSARDDENNVESTVVNTAAKSNDEELEAQLKQYRQEREDNIKEENGLAEGGSPDEENYTFDLSGTDYAAQFDTRELTEAYKAARIYVKDTLGIEPNTKMSVYMCIDPRILAIYEDKHKGVAAGYENGNIFVCEYYGENDEWEYLILVREGKGSSWKVIHHGAGYKE